MRHCEAFRSRCAFGGCSCVRKGELAPTRTLGAQWEHRRMLTTGADSEKTLFSLSDARMFASKVDPTRDSWKMKPDAMAGAGFAANSCGIATASTHVRQLARGVYRANARA